MEKKKPQKKAAKPTIYLIYDVTCLAPLKHAAWSCNIVMENHLKLWTTMAYMRSHVDGMSCQMDALSLDHIRG